MKESKRVLFKLLTGIPISVTHFHLCSSGVGRVETEWFENRSLQLKLVPDKREHSEKKRPTFSRTIILVLCFCLYSLSNNLNIHFSMNDLCFKIIDHFHEANTITLLTLL